MKKIIPMLLALVICLSLVVQASSVDIDGVDRGEWHDATSYVLINGESNCSIHYGAIKVKFDSWNSAVYICAMVLDKNLSVDNVNTGVSISVNGSSYFTVSKSNSPCNDDVSNYSFNGAVYVDENSGATTEMRIGFKKGVPKTVECVVQFIDSNGEPSNYYNLNLINESYVEITDLDIAPTKDNSDPYYNPDLLNSTLKPSTTKKKSTKTTKREEETTKRKRKTTTVVTTERWVVPDSPMIYTGRTKSTKTAKQEVVTVTSGGVTVYYYEKEVVISQVPVIISVTDSSTKTSAVTETHSQLSSVVQSATSTSAELITVSDTYMAETEATVSFSQGAKFKKISIAAGAAAFVILSCLGVKLVKKKTD